MVVHAVLDNEDVEILKDYCDEHGISVSALLRVLALYFMETTDKEFVKYITEEAGKIRQGRPKESWGE